MKLFSRIAVLTLIAALFVAGFAAAQDEGEGEAPAIVWGNQRGSTNLGPLNPIRCSGVDCADLNGLMYPSFIGLDPSDLSLQPFTKENLVENALMTGFTVENDGTRYVFTLRDDLTWSDGSPITANDIVFTFNAIQNDEAIGLSSSYGPARTDITNVEAIDDYTVAVEFEAANCLALNRAALLQPLPSAAFGWTPEGNEDFDWGQHEWWRVRYCSSGYRRSVPVQPAVNPAPPFTWPPTPTTLTVRSTPMVWFTSMCLTTTSWSSVFWLARMAM